MKYFTSDIAVYSSYDSSRHKGFILDVPWSSNLPQADSNNPLTKDEYEAIEAMIFAMALHFIEKRKGK